MQTTAGVIDLDIGIVPYDEKEVLASHEVITQKLDSIAQQQGAEQRDSVVAQILLVKQQLKAGHAYKKGAGFGDGGLGGIGVETWLLNHGGNIREAYTSFWESAHENGRVISLARFKKKYHIYDAGMNLRNGQQADYVSIITDTGYRKMLTISGSVLGGQMSRATRRYGLEIAALKFTQPEADEIEQVAVKLEEIAAQGNLSSVKPMQLILRQAQDSLPG